MIDIKTTGLFVLNSPVQFVEKVFFDKLGDFEKVCKKPHF